MELYPEVKPGAVVRVHQIIKELDAKGKEKERIQVFEGLVMKRSHRQEAGATVMVYKKTEGVGVEKIFPLNSPIIKNIEVVRQFKVRRADIRYTKTSTKKLREVRKAGTKTVAKK